MVCKNKFNCILDVSRIESPKNNLVYSVEKSSSIETTSTATYSTSAVANGSDMEETLTQLTDDTLNMISTPWSTESWTPQSANASKDSKSYLSLVNTLNTTLSSITFHPCTSTSYGISSPSVVTKTNTTITLFDLESVPSTISLHSQTSKSRKTHSDTISSWTLEYFTSTGANSETRVIKPKYPWSPMSLFSDTDIYPTSADTLESRKISRETLATSSLRSVKGTNGLVPMNYIVRTCLDEYNPCLEWELIKQKYF